MNSSVNPEWKQELLSALTHDGIKQEVSEPIRKLSGELLRRNPPHPVFMVGTATCGLGAGAARTMEAIRKFLRQHNLEGEVLETGCIGLCSEEPLVTIQLPGRARLLFSGLVRELVPPVLTSLLIEHQIPESGLLGQMVLEQQIPWEGVPLLQENPFFREQCRRVLQNCGMIDPGSIEEYLAGGGYRAFAKSLHTMTPSEICDEVERSGLRGRGGGGFPAGTKWKYALNGASDQKYMVCNADEGDPGSFMDRTLIESDPHRLIEGLAIASYAIGAGCAYIYIRAEYPLAIRRLERAIEQAREYGLLGENILDSGFDLKIVIRKGAGAFVCGEETALIRSIEGKRGMPSPRPPYPTEKGLFGKPTVINNVETIANVPGLILNGRAWFASVGTATSPGTKVFALSGKCARTGMIEVPMGTPLRTIIEEIGGGMAGGKRFKAVQIGGPSGGCVPASHIDIPVDYETLRDFGTIMGSGGLVAMDENTCMVDVAKFFVEFLQNESCGKCVPCREGTRQMREILEQITRPRSAERGDDALLRFKSVLRLRNLANVIRATSLCGLGQTAPNPVLSTLRWFREEYEAHVYDRKCPAGVCKGLVRCRIVPELCKGCTACLRVCHHDAIVGAIRQTHRIEPMKCTGCGACLTACKFHAIQLAE